MIWVIFAALTGLAVLSLLWPLSRRSLAPNLRQAEVGFYKAQLAEIDRDVARGLTSAAEAERARAQAGRRLLAATQAVVGLKGGSHRAHGIAAAIALIVVPAVALLLYLHVGNPGFPDQPLSARLEASPGRMDVGVAVARIEQHLAQEPNDGRGWAVLGPIYMRLGRFDDAARAFVAAIHLLGDSSQLEQELGEAQVGAASGQIDDRARKAFETAARLDPKAPAPQFYLGLAAEQVGDKARALALWSKLLAQAPPDVPWRPMVQAHMAALGGPAGSSAPAAGAATPSGPNAAAIASLPPGQQSAMIRRMVEGLAARLSRQGGSVDEWARLVRAYSVLHEPDKARAALTDARRKFANDKAALARLSDMARELGLDS